MRFANTFNPPLSKASLAPMAGVTDRAFRSLCTLYQAGITTSELVSTKAVLQQNLRTLRMVQKANNENSFFIQLFGDDPKLFSQAVELLENSPYNKNKGFDINAGCPVPKVMKSGGGSALLEQPNKIRKILSETIKHTNKPVSLKIRTGISQTKRNSLTIAKIAQEEGASHLTIHGRTQAQKYSGSADWDYIKKIKERVDIPIIGNGDIMCARDAIKKITKSGVNQVAIGRGALGNPHIFKDIHQLMTNRNISSRPSQQTLFQEYLKLARRYNTPFQHILMQAQQFSKGLKDSASFRKKLSHCLTIEEINNAFEKLWQQQ